MEKKKGDKSIDGFGIGNVNRRIRYYYGERYGVTLESVENDGTKATVTMAAQKPTFFVKKTNFCETIQKKF